MNTFVSETLRAALRPDGDLVASAVTDATDAAAREGAADITVTSHETVIGSLGLARSQAGVLALTFGDVDELMVTVADKVSPRVVQSGEGFDPVRRQLDEYLQGGRTDFELPLDWRLSHGFRLDVLRELVEVPYGETVSYQELARRAGRPKAARAVGSAMATNPIPIVVPCHRVLRTGGALGGYAGGLDAKRHLLTIEGVTLV